MSNFGYRHIRRKIADNKKVESLVLQGETYEYMVISEKSIEKLKKCI